LSQPDRPWLDRVVRGRVWIPLLGVLLAGIVAAQVEILKAGASMGRSLEQTSTLTNQNEQLRGSVAALGNDQRIERLAAAMGLVMPPPGAVGYLAAGRGGNVAGALANIHAPDAGAFVMMPAKNGALVTGDGTSTLPPTPGAPPPPAATTTTSSGTTSTDTSSAATTSTDTTSVSTVPQQTTTPAPTTTSTAPATSETSQVPSTGAAAIQPTDSSQTSGG
jgi:hypothetical protein